MPPSPIQLGIAMTMLEKVARAISLVLGEQNWANCIPAARAAVLAMSEPTTEMLEAAVPDLPDFGHLPEEYRAMIFHVAQQRL